MAGQSETKDPINSQCALSTIRAKLANEYFEAAYLRLKKVAARHLSSLTSDSIDATGLVHELYLKMAASSNRSFESINQFYSYAAKAMRHILVDRARGRLRQKRGGPFASMEELNDDLVADESEDSAEKALSVERALRSLQESSPRAAKVVDLHFFVGLPLDAVAEILGISTRTVNREWEFARAFLLTLAK